MTIAFVNASAERTGTRGVLGINQDDRHTGQLRLVRDLLAEVVEANWRHQQALDVGQTTAAMERIEAAAKAAGAIGSKACGAGAGGCMLFVVRPDAAEAVKTAVQAAGGKLLPVSFDFEGVRSAPAE